MPPTWEVPGCREARVPLPPPRSPLLQLGQVGGALSWGWEQWGGWASEKWTLRGCLFLVPSCCACSPATGLHSETKQLSLPVQLPEQLRCVLHRLTMTPTHLNDPHSPRNSPIVTYDHPAISPTHPTMTPIHPRASPSSPPPTHSCSYGPFGWDFSGVVVPLCGESAGREAGMGVRAHKYHAPFLQALPLQMQP